MRYGKMSRCLLNISSCNVNQVLILFFVREPLWGKILIKFSHLLLTTSSAINILIYSYKVKKIGTFVNLLDGEVVMELSSPTFVEKTNTFI